jgi:hypothetical protein
MMPTDTPKAAARFLKIWLRMLEIENRSQRRHEEEPTVNITANVQCFLERMRPYQEACLQGAEENDQTSATPEAPRHRHPIIRLGARRPEKLAQTTPCSTN